MITQHKINWGALHQWNSTKFARQDVRSSVFIKKAVGTVVLIGSLITGAPKWTLLKAGGNKPRPFLEIILFFFPFISSRPSGNWGDWFSFCLCDCKSEADLAEARRWWAVVSWNAWEPSLLLLLSYNCMWDYKSAHPADNGVYGALHFPNQPETGRVLRQPHQRMSELLLC